MLIFLWRNNQALKLLSSEIMESLLLQKKLFWITTHACFFPQKPGSIFSQRKCFFAEIIKHANFFLQKAWYHCFFKKAYFLFRKKWSTQAYFLRDPVIIASSEERFFFFNWSTQVSLSSYIMVSSFLWEKCVFF